MLEETIASVKRMQEFDSATLAREKELGASFNFNKAIQPAQKLINLYKQLSLSSLEDLPDNPLNTIKSKADSDFNRFSEILKFDPATQANPTTTRDTNINQLIGSYESTFNALYNFISYGISKTADFKRLETEARAVVQSISDKSKELTRQLAQQNEEAKKVLENIQRVAAEQGVSQQAKYFKDESEQHSKDAVTWSKKTRNWAIALLGYGIVSFFIHKIPGLEPENAIQSAQIISSKILIFAVLSFMLLLSARNFLSHKHNSIVNKHRQNALMTFNALVDAANPEHKDVILTYAASCIFAPQETGYSKGMGNIGGSSPSVVELLPNAISKMGQQ